MKTGKMLAALLFSAVLSANGAVAHDEHHHNHNHAHGQHVWWYTSSTGPYMDECANPYYFANYGYHPYPYTYWFDERSGVRPTGPFLYTTQGHLHRDVVAARQEVVEQKAVEQPAPPPAPIADAPPPPPAQVRPEGD